VEKIYDIYYDAEKGWVVMQWEGYANSAQFREGTELMLKTLTANGAHKVLANIQDMVLIGQEDQKWLEESFLPKAIASGFKAVAFVKPLSYFNQIAVESVSYKIDKQRLTINLFDSKKEAEQWLSSV
jgi:hypothetical protein